MYVIITKIRNNGIHNIMLKPITSFSEVNVNWDEYESITLWKKLDYIWNKLLFSNK